MSDELKPCPFCGIENEARYVNGLNGAKVFQCQWCGSQCNSQDDWNARPLEDALQERAKRAEAEVAALKREIIDRTVSFMGHTPGYWMELEAHARENMYDELITEIVALKKIIRNSGIQYWISADKGNK